MATTGFNLSAPVRRGMEEEAGRKVRIGTRIDPELYDWVMAQVGTGKRWSDITHAIEYALSRVRDTDDAESEVKKSSRFFKGKSR